MRRAVVSLLIVQLLGIAAASAQELTAAQQAVVRNEVFYPALLDPSLSGPVVAPYTQLAIHAEQGGTTGTFHIGVKRTDTTYGLTLSAPISKSTGVATFADRTGLRNQASIGAD